MKEFTAIPNYEDRYQINKLGDVKSLLNNIILVAPVGKNGYKAVTLKVKGENKTFTIHQLMAITFLNHTLNRKTVVDHINDIKVDNRLENLRIVTFRKNVTKNKVSATSKYIGVSYEYSRKKWRTTISINGKNKNLGRFKTELEAHNAYQSELKNINSN